MKFVLKSTSTGYNVMIGQYSSILKDKVTKDPREHCFYIEVKTIKQLMDFLKECMETEKSWWVTNLIIGIYGDGTPYIEIYDDYRE